MEKDFHVFENGIKVYRHHLLPSQIERYEKIRNVHEADEEDLFLQVLKSSSQIECFLSIGSAIGYYPLLAKKTLPSVIIHTFEPLDFFRKCFRENIKLNGFEPESFIIHSECVSSLKERVYFVEAKYGSKVLGSKHNNQILGLRVKIFIKNLLTELRIKNYQKSKITIASTISLAELIQSVGRPIDFMQMDVQGHELEILKSGEECLQKKLIRTIMTGTHGSEIHDACIQLLKKYDYQIIANEPSTKHQPDGIILASNNFIEL
jgi:FkbM family methyltransferase